jgi:uncharacterized RDD family membrane protein YckC
MDEQLTISTPEQVAFHYETAGIGSRFVASLLDHLIIFAVLFFINCAAVALFPALSLGSIVSGDETSAAVYWLFAALVLIAFLVFWGYFVIFEILWQGRTPGKRASRLRVLRRSGQPIGAGEAIIRNLVRLVDFLPGFYGIGLITMFIDRDARRLGDFAAGTIVVREAEEVRLRDVRIPQPAYSYSAYMSSQDTPSYTNPLATQNSQLATRPDPLPGISLRDVTPDDYRLMREVLERVRRGELQWERGQDLASRLAHGVASRMGHDFRDWQSRGWDPITFLQTVLDARDARGG